MPPRNQPARGGFQASLTALLLLAAGCSRESAPAPAAKTPVPAAPTYTSITIGNPPDEKPWITHVGFTDLDRDGKIDGLACDSAKNTVIWLRQGAGGGFTETVIATDLPAPVHAVAADLDGDGDLDVLVACMGRVLPNNERIGSVIVLENTGGNQFAPHVLLANTYRVT